MSTFPIQAINDWVILKPIPTEQYFPGTNLVIPENYRSQKRPMRGVVMTAGPGRNTSANGTEPLPSRLPMSVKPGQIVHYGKYSGHEIYLTPPGSEREEYLMIKEEQLYLVEEPENE